MKNQKKSIYEMVTERIIAAMEKGVAPWSAGWLKNGAKNFITKKAYRGINALLLSGSGFACNFWLTFKQCRDQGGSIKTGSKGQIIIYWNFNEKTDPDTGEIKKSAFLRYSTVFNLEQTTLTIPKKEDLDFKPLERAEKVIADYESAPTINHIEDRAFYKPAADTVNMPPKTTFKSVTGYYSVLFHELVHSTGHSTRLNRSGIAESSFFGSHAYSKEELIAELGAAFLCGVTGIENQIDHSAAYLQSWIKTLKQDPRMIMQASSAAQKAADYIQNINVA